MHIFQKKLYINQKLSHRKLVLFTGSKDIDKRHFDRSKKQPKHHPNFRLQPQTKALQSQDLDFDSTRSSNIPVPFSIDSCGVVFAGEALPQFGSLVDQMADDFVGSGLLFFGTFGAFVFEGVGQGVLEGLSIRRATSFVQEAVHVVLQETF